MSSPRCTNDRGVAQLAAKGCELYADFLRALALPNRRQRRQRRNSEPQPRELAPLYETQITPPDDLGLRDAINQM